MILATQICCFAFFTMAFSLLAGLAFWGAYALINYVKKLTAAPSAKSETPQEPAQNKSDKKPKEEKTFTENLFLWCGIILAILFFIITIFLMAKFFIA